MQATDESGERLVCAVLAAQVAALRDRIGSGVAVDLLWRTTDLLSQLSGLVAELLRRHPADAVLGEQCATAIAAEVEVGASLEAFAFLQSQRDDFARQMADCVVTALERLAAVDGPASDRLSPHDLAALYVSDDQRDVHEVVFRRLAGTTLPPAAGNSTR
jgi:hypothetical protein